MALTMAATLIVVLDTTIANVALPHMQAALGASPDTISWVLTSYILASAVALPLTGWLSAKFGRRLLFTVAVAGFTISSAWCGIANSLVMMVAARLVQGLCGAVLMPMSQAIMYDINPPEKHIQAMTLWGLVVMVGPILGPVVGGYLTDNFDWRWVFYINVPIGIVTAIGGWALLSGGKQAGRPFDAVGFVLLATALASMQLLLDRGVQLDWFDATEIWIELGVCVIASWMFVVHTVTSKHTLLPRMLFTDRNFVTACLTITVLGGILTAGAALVAPMLQALFGYPVLLAGMLTSPRGVGTMAGMLIAGRLTKRVDPRVPILTGMALLAWSLHMMTQFDLGMDQKPIIISGLVQGLGLGLVVLPLNLLALSTLGSVMRTDAASLYNLTRSIGGSITISVLTALIARQTQVSHSTLGAHLSQTRLPFLGQGIFEQLGFNGAAITSMMNAEVNRQAVMIAYIDAYYVMMWAAIAVMPLILTMKRSKADGPPDDVVMDAH
jgi:MFS transporter, DHA2 family, multidrug resistance protein